MALRIEFLKRSLNSDAALNALTCEWHFIHGEEHEEPGWLGRLLGRPGTAARARAIAAGAVPAQGPGSSEWIERGFAVSHYFPTPESQKVRVQFFDEDGALIEEPSGTPVRIEESIRVSGTRRRAWGERTRIEAIRLAVALVVAIFALLAGAEEQISKVDLVPGLIAVFLLGFSADQIKNIFK